jgi:hypothetical protein
MASVNYKVAGFSSNVKNDLGVIQLNDFRRDGAYSKDGVTPSRFSYNFDGVDDYGVLATRAINPDGDIDIEFYSPSNIFTLQQIVSQNISSSTASAEFSLESTATGVLVLRIGGNGASLLSEAQGYEAQKKYRVKVVGSSVSIWKGEASDSSPTIRTTVITRGAAREPSAVTVVGAYTNGSVGTYSRQFQGRQYNIRINGVLWQMATRNSVAQVSTPAGNTMTLVNTTSDRWQEIIE